MLKFILVVLLVSLSPCRGQAQTPVKKIKRFEFSYQYFRIERSTLINSVDFISRTGVWADYSVTTKWTQNWNWYYHLAAGANQFEITDANRLEDSLAFPWQVGLGVHYRFGRMRSMRWILGFEGVSEFYGSLDQPSVYRLRSTYSGRAKMGFGILFKSITAASAEMRGTISYPVTPLEFDNEPIQYKGAIEGTIRMKFHYTSSWGLSSKVRFEDYETQTKSVTYFNTRVMLGVFWNFK